ncbi:MAG: adenylyltransferase/cytidyltransferase family protein [Candidatus Kerfeldbacteria bacterium]|nr:adenylyltransferase/cytidyltransferase family protein [Candidatus Kerfeldbacteria bacterium]
MATRVLVFGTFDLLHPGHNFFLREAAKRGDELYVVVARDSNVERLKGCRPHENEEVRLAHVAAHPSVTNARLGYEEWEKRLQVLDDIQSDVICLGYDQKAKIPEGAYTVERLPSFEPEKYKSSIIRANLAKSEE